MSRREARWFNFPVARAMIEHGAEAPSPVLQQLPRLDRKRLCDAGDVVDRHVAFVAFDRTYVSRLERGLENPTVAVLEKLACALSSNIAELFNEM
jgi:transcriptional regulator with XRE-family HTH domain